MLFLIVFRVTWTLSTYVKHVTSVTCIAHDTAVMSMETLSGFSLSFSDTEEWNVLGIRRIDMQQHVLPAEPENWLQQ